MHDCTCLRTQIDIAAVSAAVITVLNGLCISLFVVSLPPALTPHLFTITLT